MHAAHRTFVTTGLVALLAVAGIAAAVAADPAPDGPPRIAFLANGHVAADALAAGPIAGQLGAPMYTTEQGRLVDSASDALDGYDPELVIVLGGPIAISDAVIEQVEAATGLAATDDITPAGGIVRAAGGDRFATAAAVADLLAAYDPAYLPVDSSAVDADTLDGKDASQFLSSDGKAVDAAHADDADTLAGMAASDFASTGDLTSTWVRQPDDFGNIVTSGEIDVVSTTFTAPGDGVVNIDSSIFLNQNGSDDVAVNLRLRSNGSLVATASELRGVDGATDSVATTSFPHTMAVTAGQSYTLTLSVDAFASTDIDLYYSDHRIAATFVPAGQITFDDSPS